MTIKTATRTKIERLACPPWLLLNVSSWKSGSASFDQLRSAALGIVAHLAYCDADSQEFEHRDRANVVP